MRNTEKYAGKRVLVVGMARSGIAAAQLLCKAGAHVIINDSKAAEQLGDSLKPLENLPLERRLGCPAMECLDGIDANGHQPRCAGQRAVRLEGEGNGRVRHR